MSLLRTPCSGACGLGSFCAAFAVTLGVIALLLGRLPMLHLRVPPPPWRRESRPSTHPHRPASMRARVASSRTASASTSTWDRHYTYPADVEDWEAVQILDACPAAVEEADQILDAPHAPIV